MTTSTQTPSKAPEPRPYASFEELVGRLDPTPPPGQIEVIRKAYRLAEEAHKGQRRKSGEPYFNHCVEVTLLLGEFVNDAATLAAGLLHDTIEDCGLTRETISASSIR